MNPRTPTGRDPKSIEIIDYSAIRENFVRWIKNRVSNDHAKTMISYLDRYLTDRKIKSREDILYLVNSASSRKKIVVALRNLLNYCETFELLDEGIINKYRKVLKCVHSNVDSYIPTDDVVVETYQKFDDEKYKLAYEIFATSGLRVVELVKFLTEYDPAKIVFNKNFARYPLFYTRETKHSYFVYIPITTAKKLKRMDISPRGITNYFRRRGLSPKYLRKWNYNFMIMHNVPESVADFIQGRVPVTIGSMHYLAKVKQADYWYEKIADKFVVLFDESR